MIELCIIEDDLVNFLSKIEWGSAIGYLVGIGGLILTWWNVHKSNQKPKARLRFDNDKKDITLTPHYYNKTSTKYYIVPSPELDSFEKYRALRNKYQEKHEDDNAFLLSFKLYNNGKLQLENYRVEIEYDKGMGTVHSSQVYHLRKVGAMVGEFPPDGLSLDSYKNPQVVYTPIEACPLNQKDSKQFTFVFVPSSKVNQIVLRWRIIAKDFSDNGKFTIRLKPYYTTYDEIKPVYRDMVVPEGSESIEDITPYIKQYEELLKH